jgi:hypothetical protein
MSDITARPLDTYRHHRYGILFYSLLLSLAVLPLGFSGGLFQIFLGLNLIAAVAAVRAGFIRRAALVLVFIALAARLGAFWFSEEMLSTGSLALWGIIALLAAASALVFALRGQHIGGEQIYAALSVYLLAGFFFGLLYFVMDQLAPGALAVSGASGPDRISTGTAIYFSFVTLASLGYGDVLPLSDPARGLAVIEVVGGQLYLAVMVARLVSVFRGNRGNRGQTSI